MNNGFYARRQRNNKAFTLWELTITMGLFLLVAGLVITFITFMSDFTKKNTLQSERVSQLTDVRREVDYWFSYYDSAKYEVTVCDRRNAEETGEALLAYAVELFEDGSHSAVRYEMRLALLPDTSDSSDIFVQTLVCVYPQNSFHGDGSVIVQNGAEISVRVENIRCTRVSSLCFYAFSDNWQFQKEEGQYLRFLVQLPVTEREYACVILYE